MSLKKTYGSVTLVGGTRDVYQYPDGSSTNTMIDSYNHYIANYGSVSGGECLDWRRRISRGEDATTSLDASQRLTVSDPYDVYGKTTFDNGTTSTIYSSGDVNHNSFGNDPSLLSAATADSRAITKFIRDIASAQHSASIGETLGEAASVLRSIKHPFSGLRERLSDYERLLRQNYRDSLRRKRRYRKRYFLEAARQSYLETVFGWKPLCLDIEAALTAASQYIDTNPHVNIRSVGVDESVSLGASEVNRDWVLLRQTSKNYSRITSIYRCGLVVGRATSRFSHVRESVGLTLDQFVPTLYNLIPYSWAVDYFTNIGTVVQSLSLINVRYSYLNNTIIKETGITRAILSARANTLTAGKTSVVSVRKPGSVTNSDRTITRRRLYVLPVPPLQFEIPGIGKPWVNLLAVLPNVVRFGRSLTF